MSLKLKKELVSFYSTVSIASLCNSVCFIEQHTPCKSLLRGHSSRDWTSYEARGAGFEWQLFDWSNSTRDCEDWFAETIVSAAMQILYC